MSNLAEAWAWKQDIPLTTKGVLLALADHADDEGVCWPGIKGLALKCRISQVTIRYHLRLLRNLGLISAEKRLRTDGTQTSNLYRLGVNILIPTLKVVNTPPIMGDRGTLKVVNTHESPSESPLEPSVSLICYSGMLEALRVIPGYVYDGPKASQLVAYLTRKEITPDRAEETAIAIQAKVSYERGKWSYQTSAGKQWTGDLCALMKSWVRRSPLQSRNGSRPSRGALPDPNAYAGVKDAKSW